jgi:hypothetical protein
MHFIYRGHAFSRTTAKQKHNNMHSSMVVASQMPNVVSTSNSWAGSSSRKQQQPSE